MALRGRAIPFHLNPTVAGELDDFEKFAPVQIEMMNGVRTLGGAWKRRPGYAAWKGTNAINQNSPVVGLRDFDDHLLGVSENGVIIAIGDKSRNLGVYDKQVGTINVSSRPQIADFNGTAVIVAGGVPKIMWRGVAYRLGLEIEAPVNAPTLLDWGTGDPFPGSRYDGEDPPPGGGIGGLRSIPAEGGGAPVPPPPISGGGGGSGGGTPAGSGIDITLAEPGDAVSEGGYLGDNYRGGSILEQVAEGAGSVGPSHGRWVYGYSFLTVNGETQVGPPSDFVNIETPNEGVRAVVPGTDHPFVTARRLYRARFYGKGQASVWRLVREIPGRSRAEVFDQVSDAQLGETELPYNTAQSLAPDGSRFVTTIAGRIVVAGFDRYQFAFCAEQNWLSWPAEGYRRVDAASGPITGLGTAGGALLVFCRHAIEVWGTNGEDPFTRRQIIPVGCIAPHTVVEVDGGHYFLSESRELYRLSGGLEALTVGNRDWFLDIDAPENIYGIHFPYERKIRYFSNQADRTLVYDYAQNAWGYESTTDAHGEQRMVGLIAGVAYRNMMVVASRRDGDLYEWSPTIATDDGQKIRVTRRARLMLSPAGNRARCQRVLLRMKREDRSRPGPIRPPFVTVTWSLDDCGTMAEDLYVTDDCNGPYVQLCNLGVGRELVLEITEGDDFDYMLTHAFVHAMDLGR